MSWLSRVLPRESVRSARSSDSKSLVATLGTIRDLSLGSEPKFTELAMSLNRVQSNALGMAEKVESELQAIRSSLSSLDLSGQSGYSARSRLHLERNLTEAQDMLSQLGGAQQHLNLLAIKGQEIQKLGISLEVCRSTFQVDCGRNAAHQVAFQGFTEDLHKLSVQLAELGETIETQARASKQAAEGELRRLRIALGNLQSLCNQSVATASAALESLGSTLRSAAETIETVDQSCRKLRATARQAAYHMQFGDIVRQQLEHVCQGLEWAHAGENRPQWPYVLPLEAAQLDLVHSNVSNTQNELADVIAQLHSHIDELACGLSISLPLQQLVDNVKQMARVEEAGAAIRDSAAAGFEKVTAAAMELSQHLISVQQLNHRMHLQALNAIVKSETLGRDSASLGVLSSHVHSLFLESSQLVDQTGEVLGRIVTACASSSIHDDASSSSSFDEILRPLEVLQQKLAAASNLGEPLARLRSTALAECDGNAVFLNDFRQQVFDSAASLLALADRLGAAQVPWQLEPLEAHYTMASERDVHAAVREQFVPAGANN